MEVSCVDRHAGGPDIHAFEISQKMKASQKPRHYKENMRFGIIP